MAFINLTTTLQSQPTFLASGFQMQSLSWCQLHWPGCQSAILLTAVGTASKANLANCGAGLCSGYLLKKESHCQGMSRAASLLHCGRSWQIESHPGAHETPMIWLSCSKWSKLVDFSFENHFFLGPPPLFQWLGSSASFIFWANKDYSTISSPIAALSSVQEAFSTLKGQRGPSPSPTSAMKGPSGRWTTSTTWSPHFTWCIHLISHGSSWSNVVEATLRNFMGTIVIHPILGNAFLGCMGILNAMNGWPSPNEWFPLIQLLIVVAYIIYIYPRLISLLWNGNISLSHYIPS